MVAWDGEESTNFGHSKKKECLSSLSAHIWVDEQSIQRLCSRFLHLDRGGGGEILATKFWTLAEGGIVFKDSFAAFGGSFCLSVCLSGCLSPSLPICIKSVRVTDSSVLILLAGLCHAQRTSTGGQALCVMSLRVRLGGRLARQ